MNFEKQKGEAIDLHRSGKLNEARIAYNRLLKCKFDADISHNLGLLLLPSDIKAACKCIADALKGGAQNSQHWNSFIVVTNTMQDKEVFSKHLFDVVLSNGLSITPDATSEIIKHTHYQILRDVSEECKTSFLEIADKEISKANESDLIKFVVSSVLNPTVWKIYATNLFKRDRYNQALNAYFWSHRLDRFDPETLFNIGITLKKLQKISDSNQYFQMAIALNEGYSDARLQLMQNYIVMNLTYELQRSIVEYKKVIGDNYEINRLQAAALFSVGDYEGAEKLFVDCAKSKPHDIFVLYHLACTYYSLGNLDRSSVVFEKLLELEENHYKALKNLGIIYHKQRRYQDAKRTLNNALRIDPNNAEILNNLGSCYYETSDHIAAKGYFENSLALAPNSALAASNLGSVLYALNRTDESITILKQSIELDPLNVSAILNLGIALKDKGKSKQALKEFHKAYDLDPSCSEALINISQVHKFAADDWVHRILKGASRENDKDDKFKSDVYFALAKAHEDFGEYEVSFGYYLKANSLKNASLKYEVTSVEKRFEAIKLYELENNRGLSATRFSDQTPIFIVGMPRSGTTLIEQMLSSHSQIYGCGELTYLEKYASPQYFQKISSLETTDVATEYMNAVNNSFGKHVYFVDKMPQNFQYVGLISRIFPNAKILHVKRDARAVCWSNFKQRFSNDVQLGYSFNLTNIVEYYNLYANLMAFWDTLLGERIHTINYDDLVTRPKSSIEAVLKFIGLEYEEACLHPEKNRRSVKTASQQQVRAGIYTDSSKNWRVHRFALEPYFQKLISD